MFLCLKLAKSIPINLITHFYRCRLFSVWTCRGSSRNWSEEVCLLQACGRLWAVTGTFSRATRWPCEDLSQQGEGTLCHCASAAHVRNLATPQCLHSETSSHEDEKASWASDKSKRSHTPDAGADVQGISGNHPDKIWEYRRELEGNWLWHLYSQPKVRVRAHQKVQVNYKLGKVSFSARESLFWILSSVELNFDVWKRLLPSTSSLLSIICGMCRMTCIYWLAPWQLTFWDTEVLIGSSQRCQTPVPAS